jgi:hypothetical protein
MREILFKAKHLNNGEWVEGYYLEKHLCDGKGRQSYIKFDGVDGVVVDPETVCQLTPMKVKDAVVWENDILQFGSQMGSIGVVKYIERNAGFLIKDRWGDWQWLYDVVASTNVVVLGNIFDNPELLTK